jgi:hypothetical protein
MNYNLFQKIDNSFAYFIRLMHYTNEKFSNDFPNPIPIKDLVDIHEEYCECIDCCITKWINQYEDLYLNYREKFFEVLRLRLLNLNKIHDFEIAILIYRRYFTL